MVFERSPGHASTFIMLTANTRRDTTIIILTTIALDTVTIISSIITNSLSTPYDHIISKLPLVVIVIYNLLVATFSAHKSFYRLHLR